MASTASSTPTRARWSAGRDLLHQIDASADALLKIEGCRLDVREVGQAMVFKVHLPAAETRNPVPVIERAPAAEHTPPPLG